MSTAKDYARRFADHVEAMEFLDAFKLLRETDGRYVIIGKTGISGTFHGHADILGRLVPCLSSFKEPPMLKCHTIFGEGDRATILASGTGVGPTGPYDQPYYAWTLKTEGDDLVELIEFLDTVQLETAVFGKELVDAGQ